MNVITVSGRAVRDLELRFTPDGKAVANGAIAVQRNFKNREGNYEADFIDFVSWGKQGEIMAEYIRKGDQFGISGRLQTRTYQNNEGKNVKVSEIVVSEFDFPNKPKTSNQSESRNISQNTRSDDPFAKGQPIDISDQDLPF